MEGIEHSVRDEAGAALVAGDKAPERARSGLDRAMAALFDIGSENEKIAGRLKDLLKPVLVPTDPKGPPGAEANVAAVPAPASAVVERLRQVEQSMLLTRRILLNILNRLEV